jgi:hypothetical protein
MRRPDDNVEEARIADNLLRTIELTELGLALPQSVWCSKVPSLAMP